MKPRQLNYIEPLEWQTRPPDGNKTLRNYGIQNENSDFRAHVAFKIQKVYLFPTVSGQQAIDRADKMGIRPIRAKQPGYDGDTAEGYQIPPSLIRGLAVIDIPVRILLAYPIHKGEVTTTKGMKATQIVLALLKNGMVPLPVKIDLADNEAIQISGADILINSDLKLQVKCDYNAGDVSLGGTGFLFIQTMEANIFGLH